MSLPAFSTVARLRPVAIARPEVPLGHAPYAAAEVDLDGPGECSLAAHDDRLVATWDGTTVALETRLGGSSRRHASRRHGRGRAPDALAVSLTGPWVTAWVREDGAWVARGVVDLAETAGAPDPHAPAWHAHLQGSGDRVGGFGQIGLRDLRVVTNADGTPYGEEVWLSATSAGPGGFRTGHTSIWRLDPDTLSLEHRADLYLDRAHGTYGDHAGHVVRDGERWLVAASTWGDFDTRRNPHVSCVLSTTTADVLSGVHTLPAAPLRVPTDAMTSVGTWDPHLARTDDGWLAAYVSARRFFSFHPVLAEGPDLESLRLRSAATDRRACEGVTLARIDGDWRVLASDGPDERRERRESYPVLDLDLATHGTLDADYPSNIPWPTLAAPSIEHPHGSLLIGFDATPYGGPLLGYGTHGDVVVQRAR